MTAMASMDDDDQQGVIHSCVGMDINLNDYATKPKGKYSKEAM